MTTFLKDYVTRKLCLWYRETIRSLPPNLISMLTRHTHTHTKICFCFLLLEIIIKFNYFTDFNISSRTGIIRTLLLTVISVMYIKKFFNSQYQILRSSLHHIHKDF